MAQNFMSYAPPSRAIIADRTCVTLKYPYVASFSISPAQQANGFRLRPSSAYDVDPTLLSTATPGFSEWATFYANYRVLRSAIKVEINNRSTAQGGVLIVLPLNADPGSAPSVATVTSWLGNPFHRRAVFGTAGAKPTMVSNSMSLERLFGSKMVYTDDNFTSLVTGIPTNNWYWAVFAFLTNVPAAAVTVEFFVTVTMEVEFFSRKVLIA